VPLLSSSLPLPDDSASMLIRTAASALRLTTATQLAAGSSSGLHRSCSASAVAVLQTAEASPASAAGLQRAADFLRAFLLGFAVSDAIALLRVEDLYVDSFEVTDVKSLHGEHLSRAIGRIAGQAGKTRFTIENATRTRLVIADSRIHILGSFTAIAAAKQAIVRLIMGAPPAKVYTQMRAIAHRAKERR
jgi:RNA-binding protein PNO1